MGYMKRLLLMISERLLKKLIDIFPFLSIFFLGKTNTIRSNSKLKNTKIYINGLNNKIIIGTDVILKKSTIQINGNNNIIIIGNNIILRGGDFVAIGDSNQIILGDFTTIHNHVAFEALEGRKITVGNDCMLSQDIEIRTGDSHSIVDLSGKRINQGKDIEIGEHVWIGTRVTLLKGTYIASNSVVGVGTITSSRFERGNVIVAGIPAKVIKEDINWSRNII